MFQVHTLYGRFQKYGKTTKSSILIGFSMIFTIQFGGVTPIFENIHVVEVYTVPWFKTSTLTHRVQQSNSASDCSDHGCETQCSLLVYGCFQK